MAETRKLYRYPYSIEVQVPALADIITSFKRADSKDSKSRDVRPLMMVLNRLQGYSPRLQGHIRNRKSALLATNWSIVADDPAQADEAKAVSIRLNKTVEQIIWDSVDQTLYGKVLFGIQWAPVDYGNGTKIAPADIQTIDQCDFEADQEAELMQMNLLEHNATLSRLPVVNDVERTFIGAVWKPSVPGGVLRTTLIPEWLLYMDIRDWRNFNKRAKGLAVASYKHNAAINAGTKEAADKAVKQLGELDWASVSDNIKFEFLKAVDTAAVGTYANFKEALQNDIAIAIRGAANTTDIAKGSGSRAAIEAQIYGVEEAIAFHDRRLCSALINDQLLRQDWSRNYSTGDDSMKPLPWRFVWNVRYVEDAEKAARIAETLNRMGIPLYAKDIAEKTGFTPATDAEIIAPNSTDKLTF